ncbi:hypothetical protein PIB30_034195 [Stylosanthes scabra]|uniref:Uncharacterized protein n=1 Tax=Stylosanthes scabra TaxID=79078 RepID=A0ABU6RD09_9FABA|nr:hypothetical protein [Stylosanthes scabra]
MSLLKNVHQGLSKQVMEETYSYDQGYTSWNPTPYQPHDLGYNTYQSNGFGDAYYGYKDPSPPYPPSQNEIGKLFEALAQERKEIREVQRKTKIQLDLLIKLANLVIEHLNNSSNISQPSNSENLPSQPLSNPWGHIGTLFLCTNQEGREDVLNEEDVESLHESLEEVEEGNEAQMAEDVDQKVEEDNYLPNLNFIIPQHYALLETDNQLGALDGVLDKKETESSELNASKFITCGKSEFKVHSEHLHKLHNNRAKVGTLSMKKHLGPWQVQEKLVDSHRKGWRNHVWDLGKSYKSHHFWGVITCVGAFRDLLNMNWNPIENTKFKQWWRFKDEFKHKPP